MSRPALAGAAGVLIVVILAGGAFAVGRSSRIDVPPGQHSASSSTPTTVTSPTSSSAAPSTSVTPTTVIGTIDFSSPLIAGYQQNLAALSQFDAVDQAKADTVDIQRVTGIPWTVEMLVALGASYCNDWPLQDEGTDQESVTDNGQLDWAAAVAPVLNIPVDAAYKAIRANFPYKYQYVCD